MAKKTDLPTPKKAPAKALPAEVAEKYNLKIIRPGKYNFDKFGTIDLRTISLEKADALVEKGFTFLVAKAKNKENVPKT